MCNNFDNKMFEQWRSSVFELEYIVISLIKLEVKSACGCGLLKGNFCPWFGPTNQLGGFEGCIFWVRLHDLFYCRVLKLKKSKKQKIRIFEKPNFPVRIWIRWFRSIRGVTLRSHEVRRSKKKRKKNSGKTGFPGSGSGFPDQGHGYAIGGPRATCSQNFIPLAVLEAEIFHYKTIIIY